MKTRKYSKDFEEWFSRANNNIYIQDFSANGLKLDTKYIAWKAWKAAQKKQRRYDGR